MEPYIDLHTHNIRPGKEVISVYNHMLNETGDIPAGPYSAGLHPWYADQLTPEQLKMVIDHLSTDNQLIALGESGLDKSCKIPLQVQKEIFELHLKKASEYKKPIVIHCVKAWEEVLEIASVYRVTKILHGYHGSPELTGRLVKAGFYFSIGESILKTGSKVRNSIITIPTDRLFCETDDSMLAIETIYRHVAASLSLKESALRNILFQNYSTLIKSEIAG